MDGSTTASAGPEAEALLTHRDSNNLEECPGEETTPSGTPPQDGLARVLGFWDGVGVSVGVVVGSGIFASPGQMMQHVGSTGLSLVTWGLGGLVALCSSLVYAELGPMIPTAGGDRDYIAAAFGTQLSFAFSITMFLVVKAGSQGILSLTFARYFAAVVHPDHIGDDSSLFIKGSALASVALLTALNCLGVRDSAVVQNCLTSTKAVLVALMITAAGCSLSTTSGRATAAANLGPEAFHGSTVQGLGPAMVGALWAFDGWNDIVFLAEELKRPNQLPMIIILSLAICSGLYVVVNVCYDAVLTSSDIKTSTTIALDTVRETMGEWAFLATGALVAISVLGSLNASIMCGGRLFFAGARDGDFPAFMKTVSHRTHTPYVALLAQMAIAVLLLLLPGSSFNNLVAYFGGTAWLWYGTVGAALLRLRATQPDLARPYKCPLFCAWLIMAVAAYLIGSSIYDPGTRVQTLTSLSSAVLTYLAKCIFDFCSAQSSTC